MRKISLTKYSDPGHGWYRVPVSLLWELDIFKDISSCSYIKGEYAYLEEDSDASILYEAFEKNNITSNISYKNSNNRSSVRDYESFNKNISKEEYETIKSMQDKLKAYIKDYKNNNPKYLDYVKSYNQEYLKECMNKFNLK